MQHGCTAAHRQDYHCRATSETELDKVFQPESERTIGSDWVVPNDNRYLQLESESRNYAPASGKVKVREGRDGNLAIKYRGHAQRWQQIPPPAKSTAPPGERKPNRTHYADAAPAKAEVRAPGGSPVVTGGRRASSRSSLALPSAPLFGLRGASLRARPTTKPRAKTK